MHRIPDTRASLLVRLPDARDAAAWDELLAIYGPLVYRLGRSRGLQPSDADDLVQEVFAAVARSVEAWLANERRGPFRAWLLTISRNTAVNLLTRSKHRPFATLNRVGEQPVGLRDADIAVEPDLAREFDIEYQRERFLWAADQVRAIVAPKTWRAFWATAVEDRRVADVARELGMSEGSVYIARSRVMARLRECLRDEQNEHKQQKELLEQNRKPGRAREEQR